MMHNWGCHFFQNNDRLIGPQKYSTKKRKYKHIHLYIYRYMWMYVSVNFAAAVRDYVVACFIVRLDLSSSLKCWSDKSHVHTREIMRESGKRDREGSLVGLIVEVRDKIVLLIIWNIQTFIVKISGNQHFCVGRCDVCIR